MKNITTIVLAFVVLSCNKQPKPTDTQNTHHDSDSTLVSTESKIDFYNDSIITPIDAEELCEFNFDFFLPELNEKLKGKGVQLEVHPLEDYEHSFEISINGRIFKLYSNKELMNYDFWDSGPKNFFRTVNNLLKEKGIEKRFYLLYGGNDLNALLLTEDQYILMCETYAGNDYETPYFP